MPLVAVSKKQPIDKVKEYCSIIQAQAGIPVIGENYVQEYRDKVRMAVGLFDLIESVDSFKLANLINKEAARIGKVQKIFLQVNVIG